MRVTTFGSFQSDDVIGWFAEEERHQFSLHYYFYRWGQLKLQIENKTPNNPLTMSPSLDDEVFDPETYWNMPQPVVKAPEGAQHGKSGVYYAGRSLRVKKIFFSELASLQMPRVFFCDIVQC